MLDPDDFHDNPTFPSTADSTMRVVMISAAIFVAGILAIGAIVRDDHVSSASLRPISDAPVISAPVAATAATIRR